MRNLFKELAMAINELRKKNVPLQHYYCRETPHCDKAEATTTEDGTVKWLCQHVSRERRDL